MQLEMTSPENNDVTGLDTGQMTGQDAYIHMYRLDFENTWQLTEGYPVLAWQDPEDAVDPPEVPIIRADTTTHDFGVVITDSSATLEIPIRNTGNNTLNSEVYLADPDLPGELALEQNYPNPFNPSTQIRFAIPEQAHVTLTIYDLLGQKAATLVDETRSAGWHDVTFDASGLSSGVFIYRIEAGAYVMSRKMMFVK